MRWTRLEKTATLLSDISDAVGFEVFTPVVKKSIIFWDMTA
jgi:hypothetical protein